LLAGACALALASAPLNAQSPAGPWIPPGSRLDRTAAWLIAEGGLHGLDPLTRPWRFAALSRAVREQDTLALSPSGRILFAGIAAELSAAGESTAVVLGLGAGAWRGGARDHLRADSAEGAGAMGGIWVHFVRGGMVAVLNPVFDARLRDDPDYTGKTDRFVAGRLETAYLALTGARGDLFAGRMARAWGPAPLEGLQLSRSAYALDQLAGTIRVGRLELTTIAQRLDDADTSAAVPVTRWFLAHRLSINLGRGSWLALTETGVYGGPGRGFEPSFHMPLGLGLLAEWNEQRNVNLLWGAEAHVALSRGWTLGAQAVLDDIQVDRSGLTDRRPVSGGITGAITAALPSAPVHATLGYTRVQSLTYRNSFAPYEMYASRNVGLGRNRADYDQLLVRVAARPSVQVEAGVDVSYIRQGAGDFRQAFPPDSILTLRGQGFLVAPVVKGAAWRVFGQAQAGNGVNIRADIGQGLDAAGKSRLAGSVAIDFRLDWIARRAGSAWRPLEYGGDSSPD
jgi:hypothetical protein